jgi:hypothetical protein
LQQQLHVVRLQEQQEAQAQQQVELRASQGLDGPRPCLCSSGLEQVAGISWRKAAAKCPGTCGSGGSSGGAGRSPARRSAVGV